MKKVVENWEITYKDSLSLIDKRKYFEIGGVTPQQMFSNAKLSEDDLNLIADIQKGTDLHSDNKLLERGLSLMGKLDQKMQLDDMIATLTIYVTEIKEKIYTDEEKKEYTTEIRSVEYFLENAPSEIAEEVYTQIRLEENAKLISKKKS